MVSQAMGLAVLLLAALGAALVARGAARATRLARRERTFCSGPFRGWWGRLNPVRLVWRPVCGYDLRGLRTDADERVTCPECASRIGNNRLRDRRPFRPLGTAAVCTCLAAAGAVGEWWRDPKAGWWARTLPSVALVAVERGPVTRLARPAQRELSRRAADGQVIAAEVALLCRLLASDLAADERRRNASRALDRLASLWPASRPALLASLESADRQERHFAVVALRALDPGRPPDALLRACIEDLADDRASGELAYYLSIGNAGDACEYLLRHAGAAAPFLLAAMESGDWQQRLLAAAVSAHAGLDDLHPTAVPILIAHLADNDIAGDATVAAPALLAIGPAVIPALEQLRHDVDGQRRQVARSILSKLGRPTDPSAPALDLAPPRLESLLRSPAGSPLDRVVLYRPAR